MPLIVVGADTPAGRELLAGLDKQGEIRAFVSDEAEAIRLRESGVKVALGDVSDDSHVEAASWGCFSAVLVAEAASDDRERSFAEDPTSVLEGWAKAVATAQVHRVIWVGADAPPPTRVAEVAAVQAEGDVAARVKALDEAQRI